jgi:hypothetical protein
MFASVTRPPVICMVWAGPVAPPEFQHSWPDLSVMLVSHDGPVLPGQRRRGVGVVPDTQPRRIRGDWTVDRRTSRSSLEQGVPTGGEPEEHHPTQRMPPCGAPPMPGFGAVQPRSLVMTAAVQLRG